MIYRISKKDRNIEGQINLPASKSMSNRLLMIKEMCVNPFSIHNLSDSDDTILLNQILNGIKNADSSFAPFVVDCVDAGTVARFLTAYLALVKHGQYIITGTSRMKKRPMNDLLITLRHLGAQIDCVGEEGFLPIRIYPPDVLQKTASVNCSQSSQFASALLLCAPLLKDGLILELTGLQSSLPYIEMTVDLMQQYGIDVQVEGTVYSVMPQVYKPKNITVEADWSAAAFWYEMCSFSETAQITLKGLNRESVQGDKAVISLFEKMGVKTEFFEGQVVLSKTNVIAKNIRFDFLQTPDIFPSAFVAAAFSGVPAHFLGIQNLSLKESDRLTSVTTGLSHFNIKLYYDRCKCEVILEKSQIEYPQGSICIKTFSDHRIVMAFASLALLTGSIDIENPLAVAKSYKNFWKDMRLVGFEIEEILN